MKKRALGRNLWIDGMEKPCPHDTQYRQTLTTQGDQPLVEVCGACQLRIAEYGSCDRCGGFVRLVKFVGLRRFCGGPCQSAWETQRKIEARKRRTVHVGERGLRGDKR